MAFDFDATKLGQSLAFLANNVRDLSKLKAAKLLYFADKMHLVRFGRPIVGDRYYCMDYGPVPTASLDIMNNMITPIRIRVAGKEMGHPMRKTVEQFISVDRTGAHPRLEARKSDDALDALTQTEREVLGHVVREYGKRAVGMLVELTHREQPWRRSNACRPEGSSVEIPWEYFFDGADETTQAVKEHAEEHSENRAFLSALRSESRR